MERKIEFKMKVMRNDLAAFPSSAPYLSVEAAEIAGASNVDLVVDGQVLDRDGELELREELIREERRSHAEQISQTSLLQRMAGWFRPQPTGGAFMASRATSIDVAGRYQPFVDFEKIDTDGWWIKAVEVDDTTNPDGWSYPNALDFLDRVYKLKKPAMMYVFVNTAIWQRKQVSTDMLARQDNAPEPERLREYINNDPQIRAILRQLLIGEAWMSDATKLKGTPARAWTGIALDMERYWMSYTDWYANGANCVKVNDYWIDLTCRTLYDRLEWLMMKGYIPTLPIYNYTGWWFTSTYSPTLGNWLCTKKVWLAAYYWSGAVINTTWQGVKDKLATLPDTYRPKYVYNDLPEVIQISSTFQIPEIRNVNNIPRTFDLNMHWQTKEEWYKDLGFEQVEPDPDPDPDPEPGEYVTSAEFDLWRTLAEKQIADLQDHVKALEARPVVGDHIHPLQAHTHDVGPAR
jgi:hypothetical protein